MATGNSGKGARFISGVGQVVRSTPRYEPERGDVADSCAAEPAGVRAADTPGVRHSSAIMKLLSVVGVPRWIVEVHAVPAGSPWRSAVPLRLRFGGVELAVLAFAAVGFLVSAVVPVAAYAWWAFWAAALVVVDLAVHRLPDRLTYCAAIGVWGLLLLGGSGSAWVRSLLAGLAVAGVFALSTLALGRRGFGLGDAKLALSCAALLGWVGWPTVVVGLMVAFVASGLLSAALLMAGRVRWSTHLPFGPFLVFGTLAGLALAAAAAA
jgi:leader peptidase (prepilin peptidase) / N-methyltransferase